MEKNKKVEELLKKLKKGIGDVVWTFKDYSQGGFKVVRTGFVSIDEKCFKVGGIPVGRIGEIFGEESSGKSTLALHFIAEAQKQGFVGVYIDLEHTIDENYLKQIGVDFDNFIVGQPVLGEEVFGLVEEFLKVGDVFIVVDSVSALLTSSEWMKKIGESKVAEVARLMSDELRRVNSLVAKSNSVVIFLNQIREDINFSGWQDERTSGGLALKFYASFRLRLRRKEKVRSSDGRLIGERVSLSVVKSKFSPPGGGCVLELVYGKGFSKEKDLLDMCVEKGIIKKVGSWYEYKDLKVQGESKMIEMLNDSKLSDELYSLLLGEVK